MWRRNIFIFVVALLASGTYCQDGGQVDKNGKSKENAEVVRVISPMTSDDEDEWAVSGDDSSGSGGSGFGSGDVVSTTDGPWQETTLAPETDAATTTDAADSEATTTADNEVINPTTGAKTATTDFGNAVEDPVVSTSSNGETNDVGSNSLEQKSPNESSNSGGPSFTVGIIAGVVIGAVLALLIVLFLVYRLRKRDAGSYLLDDTTGGGGYNPLPGSPGSNDKEYYT